MKGIYHGMLCYQNEITTPTGFFLTPIRTTIKRKRLIALTLKGKRTKQKKKKKDEDKCDE